MKIITLCENFLEPCFGLKASHGLSLYIEYKNSRFIYDVGQDSTYLENAKQLGVDVNMCDKIIISHGHMDHAGGLGSLHEEGYRKKLIIHKNAFRERIRLDGENVIDIGISNKLMHLNVNIMDIREDFEITKGGWILTNIKLSTGYESMEKGLLVKNSKNEFQEDDFNDELSLAFTTSKGLVVISGCSHRGAINIIKQAIRTTGVQNVYAFIGGLHLRFACEAEVNSVIGNLKQFNIKKLIIGHCTGLDAILQMKQHLPKQTQIVNNYVGYKFKEEDLDAV